MSAERPYLSLPDALLLLVVIIWGSNFSVVKVALESMPPLGFNAIRLVIAATVLLVVSRRAGFRMPAADDWRRLLALGLAGHCAYQLTFVLGLARTSVTNSSLIAGCLPVTVLLLNSASRDREPVGWLQWVGVGLAFIGLYLVVGAGAESFEQPPILVGASLGGMSSLFALAQASEADRPTPAAALVLVDIATRMEIDGARRILEFMSQKPDGFETLEEASEAIATYNPHRPRPRDLNGLKKNLRLQEDGRYRWHWDPAFINGRLSPGRSAILDTLDDAARGLRIPTLLGRGRMSDLLSQEGADEFLDLVPHAHFVDVSDAGHMVAGDKNDVFTRAVLDFLNSELR